MCGGFSYWAWWGSSGVSPELGASEGRCGHTHPTWTHRALVEVNFSVSEVGHLLEGVYRDKHWADVCLER